MIFGLTAMCSIFVFLKTVPTNKKIYRHIAVFLCTYVKYFTIFAVLNLTITMLEELSKLSQQQKAVEFSPISTYELDSTNDELEIERMKRKDLAFNLSRDLDMDILCERLVHNRDISDISIESLLELSNNEANSIEDSMGKYINFIKDKYINIRNTFTEHPKNTFHATYNRLNIGDFVNSETKFQKELNKILDPQEKFELVESHCVDIIYNLRKEWYAIAETDVKKKQIENEITKMLLNIRNFRFAININDINDIQTRLLSVDTSTLNNITILDNNKQNATQTVELIESSLINKKCLYDMYRIISSPTTTLHYRNSLKKLKENKYYSDKPERLAKKIKGLKAGTIPVAYSTYNGTRPSKEFGDYEYWNGFQAFDLDIKFDNKTIKEVDEIKQTIHNILCKYSWYIGTKTSMSNKGLHILTKVRPMHHLYVKESMNNSINKFWFVMNYYHKYTIIKWILLNKCNISQEKINQVIDKSMMQISQGIILNTDTNALWNTKYFELPIFYGMSIPPIDGIGYDEWILNKINLKTLTAKALSSSGHESLSKLRNKTVHTYDIKPIYDTISYEFSSVDSNVDLNTLIPIDETKFMSGSRDMMRHKLMRTAIHIYGASEQTKNIIRTLLKVPNVFDEGEFIGKWNYASRNPFVFEQSLALLKNSGCIFTIDENVLNDVKESKLAKAVESLRETTVVFNEVMPDYAFSLSADKPYLGALSDELIDSLEVDRVNVLEAPPGTGKTTLFNLLAEKYTVCLVCPYQSVLQNKVENDPIANKLFDVFYGNKQLSIEKGKSIATTFDKFSYMTADDYKNFDLIAIDESHLLFTSTYRSKVTTKVINNVTKFITNEMSKKEQMTFDIGMTNTSGSFLENTSLYRTMAKAGTKVVLMTGTITGELLYLKNSNILNYIKINSKHKYGKHAEFVLCESGKSTKHNIARTIANAIKQGKTVIAPTNSGDGYVASVVAQVKHFHNDLSDDEWTYYRKSNSDNKICKSINENSMLLDDTKLLFCTVYLGVGVDILNERDYLVVFDGDNTTAQDIEQFNNRIRKSKINCSIVYTALSENMAGLKEIKKSIYDTPSEFEVRDSENYKLEIDDDKRITNTNFFINKADDYGVHNLPSHLKFDEKYHDRSIDGAEYNSDKFVIHGFSADYNKIASGCAYTKYVLTNYYDYTVTYRVCIDDDEAISKMLDEISKIAKKEVTLKKANAFIKTIDFCAENYLKLENKSMLEYTSKHNDNNFDIELIVTNASMVKYNIIYTKEYEEQFKSAITKMRKLLTIYDPTTSVNILKSHISDSGRINFTEMERELKLIDYIKLSSNKELAITTADIFDIINDFVNTNDGIEHINTSTFNVNEYEFRSLRNALTKYADNFFKTITEDSSLVSLKRREEMFNNTIETIKVLYKVRKNKEGDYKFVYRKIPKFNNVKNENDFIFDEILEKYLVGESDAVEEIELTTNPSNRIKENFNIKTKLINNLDDYIL